MKTNHFLWIALTISCLSVKAQFLKEAINPEIAKAHQEIIDAKKSPIMKDESVKEATIDENSPNWNPGLTSFEKIHELAENVREEKEERTKSKINNLRDEYPDELDPFLVNPEIGVSFKANLYDGYSPPDNSMAISSAGMIVSVTNSHIDYYNNLGQLISTSSFADFFDDPALTGMIYDPVVLFDSGSNRFFMVVLHGSVSSNSKVIVCFSKSSNPSAGWWYYKLTGNPLNNGCWFDYPKIGVSENEVYVTGNLFSNSSIFQESVIYQMTKTDGYNGDPLNWQYWYNIDDSPFTMVPASYGMLGNYGPGIYFISTHDSLNFDNYHFYDLTDDMTGTPELNLYTINANFSLAGDALQLGTAVKLDVGDLRGLSAFYLNGVIHFVHNSEYANSYCGLNYNRLNVSSLSNWTSTFGLEGFDYAYPSVAAFGQATNDKSVMICFLRSGSTIYPQMRVVYCDNAGNWSGSSLVKEGETYVNSGATGGISRWGDYSGISRKQNNTSPEVWMSGCYGTYSSTTRVMETWIAQITGLTTGIEDSIPGTNEPVRIYPNPTLKMINLEFYLHQRGKVEISVIDLQGRLVKLLYKDMAERGKNVLSFNKGALTQGMYFVKIQSSNRVIANEKIVVE